MNAQILHHPDTTPNGPFAGFDVAMAFCRLTYELASRDRASKRDWFERSNGSRQDLGFTYLWSVETFQDELQAAGLEVLRTTSSLDLPGVRSGPECVAVLARKATKS